MSRVNIVSLDEAIEDNGLKILAYGHAGAGKTVMSATTGKPTILLSAEGGLLSLKKVMKTNPEIAELIQVIKIKRIDDLKDALDMFESSEERLCNWIVLDSISEITEVILKTEKEENKDARAAYGNLTDTTLDLLRRFRDLPEYNVFMTAKMVRSENSDGETYYQPLFPGKGVGNNVPYLFDEVFALRIFEEEEDGKTIQKRLCQTSLDTQYYAKDRSGELNEFERPNLAKIYKKIRGVEEIDFTMDEESKVRYAEKIKEVHQALSESETFWREIESGEVMRVDAGEDTSELEENEGVEEISEKEYLIATGEYVEDEESEEDDTPSPDSSDNQDEESEEDSETVIAVKTQYWRHEPSGDCMETNEGDNITEILSDEDVSEITKKLFLKWQEENPSEEDEESEEEQEEEVPAPAAHETKLQKAKRELAEQQAAKAKKK